MPARRQQLDEAFDRIDRFLAVQGPSPSMEAVLALQAAVEIDDAARCVIRERIAALAEAAHCALPHARWLPVPPSVRQQARRPVAVRPRPEGVPLRLRRLRPTTPG
jgi:hypothetical protein